MHALLKAAFAAASLAPVTAACNTAGSPGVNPGARDGLCRGSYGAVTVEELEVPQGATCVLRGTRVQANVKVQRGATLDARGVRVGGNIQAEGAKAVAVVGSSRVGGSVQLKQGGAATVRDSFVNGDIQLDDNNAPQIVDRNDVGGNIQVVGTHAGVSINSNLVDGNLQCKENSPAPTGGGNVVQGDKEDQCAAL
jgi:hypothetical protein